MIGPPGSGKTMLARRLPGILPDLGLDEALEVTKIYSIAGMLRPGVALDQDGVLSARRTIRRAWRDWRAAGACRGRAK